MNIAQAAARAAATFPHKPAILFEGRSITYSQLVAQAQRIATGLAHLGVGAGDRIVLFLPNVPEYCAVYLAVQWTGAVAVCLNSMLTAEETPYFIEDSGARIVFTTSEMTPRIRAERVIVCDGGTEEPDSLAAFEREASGKPPLECERDTPSAILYTSGTTGRQKGAMLSHGNILSNVYTGNRLFKTTHHDVVSLFLPLFHCFGLNIVMNGAFAGAATLVMHRRYEQDAVVDAIEQHGVTMLFAVPAIFLGIVNAGVKKQRLASLRHILSGAAPLPHEISERWQNEYGTTITEGYGLTETSPLASYNHEWNYRRGTVGTPVDLVEIKVVDANGNEVERGEWGEIAIKGPNVMLGYWQKPEATADAIRNGWFHSGDIGYKDEAGYLVLVDRVKDMINCAGFKVWPREIEEVLFRHPHVKDCAVVGIPDDRAGEAVKAFVVLQPDAPADTNEIHAYCREQIATYKVPREFEITDAIPKNPTGKTLKRVLRSRRNAG